MFEVTLLLTGHPRDLVTGELRAARASMFFVAVHRDSDMVFMDMKSTLTTPDTPSALSCVGNSVEGAKSSLRIGFPPARAASGTPNTCQTAYVHLR